MRLVDLFPDFVYYFILISKHLLFLSVNKKSIQYEIYSMLSILFYPLAYQQTHAQVYFKTEYISSTSYKDEENKLSGAKGDLKVIQGGFRIPLSVKMNENNRPTAWAIGCGASHASMNNKKLPETLCPSDMLNLQIGLTHTRPLNAKWSMLATVGAGLYIDSDNLSKARWDNILGQGAIVFIRHLRPNLDLGVGAALNNTFGLSHALPRILFQLAIRRTLRGKCCLN